jgi:hypothetical protein
MPGRLRSSRAIFFARFSMVPGMWHLHRHSEQSTWLPPLQLSDNSIDKSRGTLRCSSIFIFVYQLEAQRVRNCPTVFRIAELRL